MGTREKEGDIDPIIWKAKMAEQYDISMYWGPLAPQPKSSRIFQRPGMTEPSEESLFLLGAHIWRNTREGRFRVNS
jgi:hypothetical protein